MVKCFIVRGCDEVCALQVKVQYLVYPLCFLITYPYQQTHHDGHWVTVTMRPLAHFHQYT
jgi:hypothetical protein